MPRRTRTFPRGRCPRCYRDVALRTETGFYGQCRSHVGDDPRNERAVCPGSGEKALPLEPKPAP